MIEPSDTVQFSPPERDTAAVSVNGRHAGEMRRYSDDYWTYDFGGVAFVGPKAEVRKAIQRVHAGAGARQSQPQP